MDALIAAIERIEVSFPPGGDIAASVRKPAPALKPGSVWNT
jgi:hypothetical protein